MIDATGGTITALVRARAIAEHDFCDAADSHCDKKGKDKLLTAGNHLRQFLEHALTPPGHDLRFEIHSSGQGGPNLVPEFMLTHHYVGTCKAAAKPAGTSDTSKGSAALQPGFLLRSQIDDLRFDRNAAAYKGLDAAKLGYDDDQVAGTTKYSAQLALGFRVTRIPSEGVSDYVDLIPFLSYSEKRTSSNPPPKKPGTNLESAGFLFDVHTSLAGGNSVLLYPKYAKSRQDGSEVASLNVHWNPQMEWIQWQIPQVHGQLFYWQFEPDINLGESHVTKRGTNPDFVNHNGFFRYGPEANLRLFGYPGSVLEKLSFSAGYRFFGATNGPVNSLKNLQISLSYSPSLGDSDSAPKASFSLTFSQGQDLDTLSSLHELILGIGLKY